MTAPLRTPSCAAIVATRNRGDKIAPLLESIVQSDLDDFELVIVDQSSDDSTEQAVQPFLADDRFTFIRSSQVGLSRARNLAIANTTAEFIAITDDDCIVPPNWLRAITSPMRDDPQVGVVFCTVRPVPVDKIGHTPHIIFDRNRKVTSTRSAWASARGGLCLGAGMAIRRAAFDDVGGFDLMLGPGSKFGAAEDNDLSWRCLLRGWATYQTADVTVMHDGFRDLDELRELVVRDFYGVGGTAMKYLRAGKLAIVAFIVTWLVRFGVVGPARDLLAGRRPQGFRRPLMLVRGLVDGLRTPFDRATIMYDAPPDDALERSDGRV